MRLLSIIGALLALGFALPADAGPKPVKGAVQGTAHVGKGVVNGAGQVGTGIFKGAGSIVSGTAKGVTCLFSLGNRC
jgi:hypothetical protein